MRKLNFYICVAFLLALVPANNALGATCCDQTFTIYGKTQGDYSILLWELFIGGECYFWYTYIFVFNPDTVRQFTSKADYGGKGWAYDFILNNNHERIDTLKNDSGIYRINAEITISPPAADTSFPDKWRMVARDQFCGAGIWYKNCPVNCLDLPNFMGCNAQLIYSYDGGLYKNYSIKEAYYFPESDLVIILTDQPIVCVGMDRMDGIMMFKLLPPEEEK